MATFKIDGGYPLNGTISPSGNKNAALPLLAACLLTDEPVTLHNVPRIRDVEDMLTLLSCLDVEVEEKEQGTYTVHARSVRETQLDPLLCGRIRGSILMAGPMLARVGQVTMPLPGGDVIGRRRVDTHLLALGALGAEVGASADGYTLRSRGLQGKDILLDEASVTGTENTILAAVLARGTTIIRNAASEPHVQDLCHFLNSLGAQIANIGSNTVTIEGVDRLHGGSYSVHPDYIEVGSLIGLGAVTPGEIRIRNVVPDHLRMVDLVFRRLGVEMHFEGNDLIVHDQQDLRVVEDAMSAVPKIDDAPWPAFPADMMSVALIVATQAQGTILIHEKMFESRLYFVDRLIQMGARIILCDPHRCVVVGPSRLHGERLASPDIRAGMALLIAALCAQGHSTIGNIGQIDRGYERIDDKLRALGAHIERVA